MLPIVLALAASASWGLGDFLGGLTSRRLHVLTVLVVQQVFGLAAVILHDREHYSTGLVAATASSWFAW